MLVNEDRLMGTITDLMDVNSINMLLGDKRPRPSLYPDSGTDSRWPWQAIDPARFKDDEEMVPVQWQRGGNSGLKFSTTIDLGLLATAGNLLQTLFEEALVPLSEIIDKDSNAYKRSRLEARAPLARFWREISKVYRAYSLAENKDTPEVERKVEESTALRLLRLFIQPSVHQDFLDEQAALKAAARDDAAELPPDDHLPASDEGGDDIASHEEADMQQVAAETESLMKEWEDEQAGYARIAAEQRRRTREADAVGPGPALVEAPPEPPRTQHRAPPSTSTYTLNSRQHAVAERMFYRDSKVWDNVATPWDEFTRTMTQLGFGVFPGNSTGSATRFPHADYGSLSIHRKDPMPYLKIRELGDRVTNVSFTFKAFKFR